MFEAAIRSICTFGNFREKELAFFGSKLRLATVNKNNVIIAEGKLCQAIYFIISGSAIHYLPSPNGTDVVVNLYTTNSWFTDYQAFTSQKPALAYVKAFEDCNLAVIGINDIHDVILQFPAFFMAGRLLEMLPYTDVTTLDLSPDERYKLLLEEKPELLRTFPLKVLASYLRVTPETLSRIRKRI